MKWILALALAVLAPLSMAQGYSSGASGASGAAKLKALEKAYVASKAAYAKQPKNAAIRQKYVDATVKYGHESMVSDTLDRKIKYVQALRLYREALKLDPKNPVAKPESDLIISIYKSMGRPIPKD